MTDILKFPGTLLSEDSNLIAPYTMERQPALPMLRPLQMESILNYNNKKFTIDYNKINRITIINGMGVTLGDSIIGLCCLDTLKANNTKLKINIIRPGLVPDHVELIYQLNHNIINSINYMPYPLKNIDFTEIIIDIGNHLYREQFNTMEMHDFFFTHLGSNFQHPDSYKKNSFLRKINTNRFKNKKYVLFCPYASTKLRSIPDKFHKVIINKLFEKYKMQVLGFSREILPNYTNIAHKIKNTHQFIDIISNASFVYTVDSSAVHIAAGFDIPTSCIFTSIRPEFRTKYYPFCKSKYIGIPETENLHKSDDLHIMKLLEEKFYEIYY